MSGKEIDQLWLDEPQVLDQRFHHRIPDRRGRLVQASPLLTGTTADGRRVTMRRDGSPRLLNTPIEVDEAAGTLRVTAADAEGLQRQTDRQTTKLEKQGRTVTPLRRQAWSDRPEIAGRYDVYPGRWHRMAAKTALALLAEQQPASWRAGESAARLRKEMRAHLLVNEVRLESVTLVESFAAPPATAVILSRPGTLLVTVALMGIYSLTFSLADDLNRSDWVWVSDPLDSGGDTQGTLGEVIYARSDVDG